jgi:hypothetical protein
MPMIVGDDTAMKGTQHPAPTRHANDLQKRRTALEVTAAVTLFFLFSRTSTGHSTTAGLADEQLQATPTRQLGPAFPLVGARGDQRAGTGFGFSVRY